MLEIVEIQLNQLTNHLLTSQGIKLEIDKKLKLAWQELDMIHHLEYVPLKGLSSVIYKVH